MQSLFFFLPLSCFFFLPPKKNFSEQTQFNGALLARYFVLSRLCHGHCCLPYEGTGLSIMSELWRGCSRNEATWCSPPSPATFNWRRIIVCFTLHCSPVRLRASYDRTHSHHTLTEASCRFVTLGLFLTLNCIMQKFLHLRFHQ